ncbi:MAG: hypothetical protein IH873_07690 [Chloroflexi bacterium]|nr:hypothetical protein [Chloroflexota bacterium]
MTTLSTIQANVTPDVSQISTGLLDRLLDWMEHVVDAFCGPAAGDARHENPAAAYLFLNPSCCGAVIDSKLWDLLTDEQLQPETEGLSNV